MILMPRPNTHLRLVLLSAAVFFFVSFEPASATISDTEGPSVEGNFEIVSTVGPTRHIEFHATQSLDGRLNGATTFRDDPVASQQLLDGGDAVQSFFFTADFDCLAINKNRAVMGGEIKESSSQQYVGRRVLVVAIDNGGTIDPSKTDRLTWGVYHADQKTWLQSDSERSPDEMSPLSWIATDSERLDDGGVPSNKESIIGCQSFPLSAFSFISPKEGHGSVRVKP